MKISGSQVFWMMLSMEYGMTALLTLRPAFADARQDAWMSMIIAGIANFIMTYIAVKLSLLYPNQTLIEYSQAILGKWLGKIAVIPYFVMWLSVSGIIMREYADFVHLTLFNRTPLWVVIFIMACATVYASYQGGIESIGRCSEILGPIIVLAIVISVTLSATTWDHTLLLPVYANTGLAKILRGSLPGASFLGESVMMMMLVAFMSKPNRGLSRALWGVSTAAFLLVVVTLSVAMTFGPNIPPKMWYPVYSAVRYISVMGFIQNTDVLIVVVWIMSIFIKLSMYLFITSYGAAQWLHIKNWRNVLWAVAVITFVIGMLPRNIDVADIDYPTKVWNPYLFPLNMILLPVLLWIVGTIRRKIAHR